MSLRRATENYPRSIFCRFEDVQKRNEVWRAKAFAKKNGLLMEEWLTEHRARLYKKCKELKAAKLIKDAYTEEGEVYAILLPPNKKIDTVLEKRVIILDNEFDRLVKDTRKKANEESFRVTFAENDLSNS